MESAIYSSISPFSILLAHGSMALWTKFSSVSSLPDGSSLHFLHQKSLQAYNYRAMEIYVQLSRNNFNLAQRACRLLNIQWRVKMRISQWASFSIFIPVWTIPWCLDIFPWKLLKKKKCQKTTSPLRHSALEQENGEDNWNKKCI